jgi:hypothetical protein
MRPPPLAGWALWQDAKHDTRVDVEHCCILASREFNRGLSLWKHPKLRRGLKLRMFRRHLMQPANAFNTEA